MPIILSYTRDEDLRLKDEGCAFMGSSSDKNGEEVHIWYSREENNNTDLVVVNYHDDKKGKHESFTTSIEGDDSGLRGYGYSFDDSIKDLGKKYHEELYERLFIACHMCQGRYVTQEVNWKGEKVVK